MIITEDMIEQIREKAHSMPGMGYVTVLECKALIMNAESMDEWLSDIYRYGYYDGQKSNKDRYDYNHMAMYYSVLNYLRKKGTDNASYKDFKAWMYELTGYKYD